MPIYKNISDHEQTLIHIGIIKAGETIETETIIENDNFVRVDALPVTSIVGTEQPQSSVVNDATPVDETTNGDNE